MKSNDNVARLNAAEIQTLTKGQLRAACRMRGITYSGMDNAAMREAVQYWEERRVLDRAPEGSLLTGRTDQRDVSIQTTTIQASAPPDKVIDVRSADKPPKQTVFIMPSRPSCSAIASTLAIGHVYELEALAAKYSVRKDSLRTVLADHCNERHPYSKRGLRFKIYKGFVTRTE